MHTTEAPFEGCCGCGALRFRMNRAPMFVHGCHCTRCQRETGAAFAINAIVETSSVEVLQGQTHATEVPTPSGKGQQIVRCATCGVAVWSHYLAGGRALAFVRVGTLDERHRISPDIHIYTSTKHPAVVLPPDVPAVDAYYRAADHWPEASRARAKAARGG